MAFAGTTVFVPALVAVRWWRRRRKHRSIAHQLAHINDEPFELPEGLSPSLALVAQQAHTLRLTLETPVWRVQTPLLRETPWARRERCDQYDAALAEVRRATWDWMREVTRLPVSERTLLVDLGLSLSPFRRLLFGTVDRTDDPWEQVLYAQAPDLDRVYHQLQGVMLELRRLEQALAAPKQHPYRAA